MRALPGSTELLSTALAGALAVFWAADAWSILAAPLHGFGDLVNSRLIFVWAHLSGIPTEGLLRLAVFRGAVSLTVAGLFVAHLHEHIRRGPAVSARETLDAALMLAGGWTVALAAPAAAALDYGSMRVYAAELLLLATAAALRMVDRRSGRSEQSRVHRPTPWPLGSGFGEEQANPLFAAIVPAQASAHLVRDGGAPRRAPSPLAAPLREKGRATARDEGELQAPVLDATPHPPSLRGAPSLAGGEGRGRGSGKAPSIG